MLCKEVKPAELPKSALAEVIQTAKQHFLK